MPSRDWFALGVRLMGLWALYYAFANFLHLGTAVLGISPDITTKEFNGDAHIQQMYNLWYVAGYLGFTIYLLLGAERLTRWVYSEPSPQSDSDSDGSPK